jgi:quercetin dioxygenase-like cupin family protein
MLTDGRRPSVNTAAEPPIYFLGLPTLVRATAQTTSGAFGLIEQLMMPPGFASPYHTHHREDEAFYVLEGDMAFVFDGAWTKAGPGTYIFGPRNIPHGFKVVGDVPARILLLCTPGGFEQFVVELSEPAPAPPDMAKLVAMAAKYGIDVHGPLPNQPEVAKDAARG